VDSKGPCEQLAVVDAVSRNRRVDESLWLRGGKRIIPVRRRVGHRRLATASLYMTYHDKHFVLAGLSQESVSCVRRDLPTTGADRYSGTHMLWCRRLYGIVCKDEVLIPSQRTCSSVPSVSMQWDRELKNRGRQGSGEFSCRGIVLLVHRSGLSGPLFVDLYGQGLPYAFPMFTAPRSQPCSAYNRPAYLFFPPSYTHCPIFLNTYHQTLSKMENITDNCHGSDESISKCSCERYVRLAK